MKQNERLDRKNDSWFGLITQFLVGIFIISIGAILMRIMPQTDQVSQKLMLGILGLAGIIVGLSLIFSGVIKKVRKHKEHMANIDVAAVPEKAAETKTSERTPLEENVDHPAEPSQERQRTPPLQGPTQEEIHEMIKEQEKQREPQTD